MTVFIGSSTQDVAYKFSAFRFLIFFLALLVPVTYLIWLIKMHLRIKNHGWKRLLLVVVAIAIPSIFAISTTSSHFELESPSAYLLYFYLLGAMTYASTLSLFFLIKWIVDGFNGRSV
jgi:hypothetical protein